MLEKSEALRVDGGSIGVHVNGWRVLEQLGIAAELRETANLVTAYVSSLPNFHLLGNRYGLNTSIECQILDSDDAKSICG